MDKQRSTKHTYITKNRVTRTPLKTEGELRCSGRISISWSTSDTRRVEGQSRIDNPEKLAIFGTQYTGRSKKKTQQRKLRR